MAVLIVLMVSWVTLRLAGAAGVAMLETWRVSARYALVVMFLTAAAHFNKMKYDLVRMIPTTFPNPLLLVYVTGFFLSSWVLWASPSLNFRGSPASA
jgi:hypothetical protein